ncbi:hypothetical protein JW960_19065 [candidate division KSB1 bacterium]|nr:hypothetical protein [candidate division KSB1 bacterium]
MYARKNSITLAIFLIVFVSIGFYMSRNGTKELLQLKAESLQLEQRYNQFTSVASRLHELELERSFLTETWRTAPKVLIAADEPAFSYLYLNKIINERKLSFDFNFILSDKIKRKMFTSYIYTLEGEGPFQDVYTLLWYLSETPILYKIQSFSFRNVDNSSDQIKYSLKLQSFSMNKEWMIGNEGEMTEDFDVPVTFANFSHNSFMPLIRTYKSVNTPSAPRRTVVAKKPDESNLPDIRKSTLQAAMAEKVLIKDQANRILTLSLGDKVQGGYLSKVDLRKSEAEFLMNNQEVVTIGLGYIREGGSLRSTGDDSRTLIH